MEKKFSKIELQKIWEHFSPQKDFDKNQLLNLSQDTDEDTVFKILTLFQDSLGKTILDVQNAILKDNIQVIWQSAHKIASSAELLGFKTFGRFSRELSHQLKESVELENHREKVEQFMTQAKKLKTEIDLTLNR